ncbi:MAG TPA: glycine zipper 2TM domain-containing protein, partial [Rhodospirillales bacterium]|nr:glycine zipper 2TM domain-containing protein [Rhodospirillales bacterium]
MNILKSLSRVSTAVIISVPLIACQTLQDNPKQTGGTLLGAGLGALIGSQIGSGKGQMAAIAVGVLAGAWAGSEVGKSLD